MAPPRRRQFVQAVETAPEQTQLSAPGLGAPSDDLIDSQLATTKQTMKFAGNLIQEAEDMQTLNISNQIDELQTTVERTALAKEGRNAFTSADDAEAEFAKGMQEIEGEAFTSNMKQAFRAMKLKGESQIRKTTEKHTLAEAEKVRSQDFTSKSVNMLESSLLNWKNDERLNDNAFDFATMSELEGRRQGLSKEAQKFYMASRMSVYHKTVFDKLILEKDVERASQYAEHYESIGEINSETFDHMTSSMKESFFRGTAQQITDGLMASEDLTEREKFSAAREIEDSEMRDEVVGRLKTRVSHEDGLNRKDAQQQQIDAINDIEDLTEKTGKGVSAREAIDVKIWKGMTAGQKNTAKAYANYINPNNKTNPDAVRKMKQLQTTAYDRVHKLWMLDPKEFMKQTGHVKDKVTGKYKAGRYNLELLKPILGEKYYNEFKRNQEKHIGEFKKDVLSILVDNSLSKYDDIYGDAAGTSESEEFWAFTFGFGETDEEEDAKWAEDVQRVRHGRFVLKQAIDAAVESLSPTDRLDSEKVTKAIDSVWLGTVVDRDNELGGTGEVVFGSANLPWFLASEVKKREELEGEKFGGGITFTDDARRKLKELYHIPGAAKYDSNTGLFKVEGNELKTFMKLRDVEPLAEDADGNLVPITGVWVTPTGVIIQKADISKTKR